ncbi:hypothetical protein S2M10_21010 [Sphingomonas sp. S2M10]|nr:hypothetical protein [Sphingomonas sp. S2M10]
MRKVGHRLVGVLMILAACGTTLVHRAIWTMARHGPAQAAEMGLALTSFVLASLGMLLLLHGDKLCAGRSWGSDLRTDRRRRDLHLFFQEPVRPGTGILDTRDGVAGLQAFCAIHAARHRLRTVPLTTDRNR